MKIEESKDNGKSRVCDLRSGDVFKDADGDLNIVLDERYEDMIQSAVLADGMIQRWDDDNMVTPVNAKVVIE